MDILRIVWEWLIGNWDNALVVFLFLAVLGFLWIRGKKSEVRDILYKLIAETQKKMQGEAGKLKKIEVLNEVYAWMPGILKIFISRKMLDGWIDDLVEEVKMMLKDKEANKLPTLETK